MTLDGKCKALLIVNPKARNGASAQLQEGMKTLQEAGIATELFESHSAEQTREIIAERHRELDLVIIGGGDGTISSAAQTLHQYRLPLAVLPLGTANDLARSLGLPEDIEDVFAVIARRQLMPIDLGSVNGRCFFNVANMGLGVKVTEELTPEVKKHWGVLSYLRAFFAALMRVKQFKVRLQVDGRQYKLRSIQLAVGNGRYYGGGNVVDERSRIDDGEFSLYSIKPQSVWEFLTLAPLLREGRQKRAQRVVQLRGKEMELTTRPKRMEIHADGEPIAHTPAKFELLPGALQVVVDPNTFTAHGDGVGKTEND
ncbi:lipid kinase [Gilvimarinus chinensis]|uniref:lipid kinase n=1 Tax=Gilvimarinus chinensis TaxID=396005 RepID=UPI0003701B53|nr:lipid kinase [Gilvimarinus chinensis]